MRAVSFVEKIDLEFTGNLYKDAITLGDVDNDGDNELIVGNSDGVVGVFKGLNTKPWKRGTNYGMITSIVVGDILNDGKNYIVVISGDGWCNIIDANKRNNNDKSSNDKDQECYDLCAFHNQRLPANIKVAILVDVIGDGKIELVVGMTDRVVRSYKWKRAPESRDVRKGKLVGLSKWELAKQIGNISIGTDPNGKKCLYVSQPGGTFVTIHCNEILSDSQLTPTPFYHALPSARMRNAGVSTEVMGEIFKKKLDSASADHHGVCAVATLDGTLMLVGPKDEILYSLQVDHQLFALKKMNVTSDDQDEIIVCSWDGQTYIVNHELQVIRFQFQETVCTFFAGYFAIKPKENVPCLIYSTFNERICLYYNVRLPAINTFSLFDVMATKDNVNELVSCLHVDSTNSNQMRTLYQWCLYGYPSNNSLPQ